jgi:hypothetical protein
MRLVLAFLVALTAACSAAGRVDTGGSGGGTGAGTGTGTGGAVTTGTGGGGSLTVGSSTSSSGIPDGGAACANVLDLDGCPCNDPGATRPCYSGPSKTENVGTCKPGTQTCGGSSEVATWGACAGDVIPAAENCAGGVDTNCNGVVGCADPACVGLAGCCTGGTTRPCYTGPNGTEGVGPCHGGTQLCSANGSYGPCMGEVLPSTEAGHCADGIDHACVGLPGCENPVCWLDPTCLPKTCTAGATQPCYTGPSGTEGVGPCHGGTQICASSGQSWGACTGEVLPAPEGGHCTDGIDNDCNGHVDCADPACATATTCCTNSGGTATSTLWANDPDTLYEIDPTTFAVTTVGSFGVADQMTDVAVTPGGQLFGVSFTTLYSIDMSTGAATAVADVGGATTASPSCPAGSCSRPTRAATCRSSTPPPGRRRPSATTGAGSSAPGIWSPCGAGSCTARPRPRRAAATLRATTS